MTFVTVTNMLPAGDESLGALSDAEIIAFVKSEFNAFLDGACWIVERGVCFDDESLRSDECLRSLADAEEME